MAKDEDRPRKHVRVVELPPVDIGKITGGALPVQRIDVNLGGDRKGIVFTISRKSLDAGVEAGGLSYLERTARHLGDLVHPHCCTVIVLPEGESIHAYEVTAS